MSANSNSKIVLSLGVAAIAVAATWFVRHPEDATRRPASKPSAALRADVMKKSRIETHTKAHAEGELHGKATGSFSIEIKNNSGDSSNELELRAVLIADRSIRDHEFTWILPVGYRVVDGPSLGRVPDLATGSRHEIRITLRRETSERKPIVLHVFKLIGSEPKGQVAQYDDDDLNLIDKTTGEFHKPANVPFLKGETIIQ